MRLLLLIVGVLLVSSATTWASSQNDTPMTTPISYQELPEFRVSRGEILYTRYCLFCHGKFGAGDGLNAYNLPTKPASFVSDNFRAKPSKQAQKIIMEGSKVFSQGKAMPSFIKTLSLAQINTIIDYIRNLEGISIEDEPDDPDEL